jgi:hypothetical protein
MINHAIQRAPGTRTDLPDRTITGKPGFIFRFAAFFLELNMETMTFAFLYFSAKVKNSETIDWGRIPIAGGPLSVA